MQATSKKIKNTQDYIINAITSTLLTINFNAVLITIKLCNLDIYQINKKYG